MWFLHRRSACVCSCSNSSIPLCLSQPQSTIRPRSHCHRQVITTQLSFSPLFKGMLGYSEQKRSFLGGETLPCVSLTQQGTFSDDKRSVKWVIQQLLKVINLLSLFHSKSHRNKNENVSPSVINHEHLKCPFQQWQWDTENAYSSVKWKDLIHPFHCILTSGINSVINFLSDLAWKSWWRLLKSNKGRYTIFSDLSYCIFKK